MTFEKAAKAMALARAHKSVCSRCFDIAHGSCDRCFGAEELDAVAKVAEDWVMAELIDKKAQRVTQGERKS